MSANIIRLLPDEERALLECYVAGSQRDNYGDPWSPCELCGSSAGLVPGVDSCSRESLGGSGGNHLSVWVVARDYAAPRDRPLQRLAG
jgi:hypothetical protein